MNNKKTGGTGKERETTAGDDGLFVVRPNQVGAPVMPWENNEEFEKFATRIHHKFNTDDPVEEILVERVVACAWRLRRLMELEREQYLITFAKSQGLTGEPLSTGEAFGMVDFKALNQVEAFLEKGLYKAVDLLRKYSRDNEAPANGSKVEKQ
jgi:hypothetical protein